MFNWTSIASKFLKEVFETEKAKEFKKEFIDATIDWIKPFFLEEIPEEEMENTTEEKIDAKIQQLSSEPESLNKFKSVIDKLQEHNVLSENEISIIKGNIKIGNNSEKNIKNEITKNKINLDSGDFIIGGN